MAGPRANALDLARQFDSATRPLYVVSAARRIVFLNRACADWLACETEALVGLECRYHSLDVGGAKEQALAAALCPPPEAFVGRRMSAVITPPPQVFSFQERRAEFIPFSGGGEPGAAVLALVDEAAGEDDQNDASIADETARLHAIVAHHRQRQRARYDIAHVVGESLAMRRARAQIELAALGTSAVLVLGQPGSGRQHVARAIHHAGGSAAGSLVPLACEFLGAELLQATIRSLARAARQGAEDAPRTLVLNEVSRLPPEGCAELAGFLLTAELPFRVVSTSTEPLAILAERGSFPRELAAALSTLVIELPPLSRRAEDVPALAQLFLEEHNAQGAKQLGGFTSETLDRLAAHAWTGQVDELAQVVAKAHRAAEGPLVTLRDLDERLRHAAEAARRPRKAEERIALDEFLGEVERELIERALARAKGNKTKAARLLGMTRPRLYRRLVQLGLAEEQPGFVAFEPNDEQPAPPTP